MVMLQRLSKCASIPESQKYMPSTSIASLVLIPSTTTLSCSYCWLDFPGDLPCEMPLLVLEELLDFKGVDL